MGEPWAIRPEVHDTMVEHYEAALSGRMVPAVPLLPQAAADDPAGPLGWNGQPMAPQVEVLGPVALMRVHGIIGKHLSSLAMQCGGVCLGVLDEQLENVLEDDAVETLVLELRTPGGVAIGLSDTVGRMDELREAGKTVIGYADYECCSAGYYLAAGCTEFHAAPTAQVGSISTFMAGVDSSEAWAKEGRKLELVRTGRYKAIGMPGKAWTEEEREYLAERTEYFDEGFKTYVRERRGLGEEEMQGQVWEAQAAPAGVVDSVEFRTLKELLEAVL
jgi:ClpP class serine protease